MTDLTPETLAEWREGAEKHNPGSDPQRDRILALLDALTAEKARAEQAEAELMLRDVTSHDFLPVAGHPDDECTYRADGTDATYCGQTAAQHELKAERDFAEAALSRVLADVEALGGMWIGRVAACAAVGNGTPCSACTSRREVADEFLTLVAKYREGQ